MRHFIVFLGLVFLTLFLFVINRTEKNQSQKEKRSLRVFSYSSFSSKYGPGLQLKEAFEKSCDCQVNFIEGNDSGVLIQKLKLEGQSLGADLVIGFDQYDLQRAIEEVKWREVRVQGLELDPGLSGLPQNKFFVPYDWGVLTFIARKSETPDPPKSLRDFLKPEYKRKIALQDPRYSSPGLQFLFWVVRVLGEEEGFRFLKEMISQAHSFAPSWSTAYGLFQKKQAQFVFSYFTSPLYHEIEEKDLDYYALTLKEPPPVQLEFVGIPDFCRQCELSEMMINLMMSLEGQRIIMNKNYMFPVLREARVGTPFESVNYGGLLKLEIPSSQEVDRLLKRWTEIRRSE